MISWKFNFYYFSLIIKENFHLIFLHEKRERKRVREKEKQKKNYWRIWFTFKIEKSMCMCAIVRERERLFSKILNKWTIFWIKMSFILQSCIYLIIFKYMILIFLNINILHFKILKLAWRNLHLIVNLK